MKKIFTLIIACVGFASLTFAQSNKVGSGSNFYSTLSSVSHPALTAPGGNALVYVDYAHVNDEVVSTLTSEGYTVTVATDWSNFNTLLAGGTDLAVAFAQHWSATSKGLSYSTVESYISGGGKMIFATWSTADLAFANLFEANFTGNFNMTMVCSDYISLKKDITGDCFTLSNPGWEKFSFGLSPIGNGTVAATYSNGDAAIILGNNGNTIMLGYLSDTPSVKATAFSNVTNTLTTGLAVPISYWWIVLAFVVIAVGVVFTKRKVIFG